MGPGQNQTLEVTAELTEKWRLACIWDLQGSGGFSLDGCPVLREKSMGQGQGVQAERKPRDSYQDKVCMELKLSVPWQEGCPRNRQPQDTPSEVVSALTQPTEEDPGLEEKQG